MDDLKTHLNIDEQLSQEQWDEVVHVILGDLIEPIRYIKKENVAPHEKESSNIRKSINRRAGN